MKRPIAIYVVASIFLFFVINRVFFFSPTWVETASGYVMYPALTLQKWMVDGVDRVQKRWVGSEQLMREVMSLQADNEELRSENVRLRMREYEMDGVADLLSYKYEHPAPAHMATVLTRHLSDDAQYLVVDAGSLHGIKVNMTALYKNCLVGRVTDVHDRYSKITVVTDRACKVAAVCTETGTKGIHEGSNTLQETSLAHVSHLSVIKEGDLVVSSGEGLVFPRGLGLGTIARAQVDGVTYRVQVKPLIDVATIEYCFLC